MDAIGLSTESQAPKFKCTFNLLVNITFILNNQTNFKLIQRINSNLGLMKETKFGSLITEK